MASEGRILIPVIGTACNTEKSVFTAEVVPTSMIHPSLVAELIWMDDVTVVCAGGFLNQEILTVRKDAVAHDVLQTDVSLITLIPPLVYKVFVLPTETLLFEVRIVVRVSPIS